MQSPLSVGKREHVMHRWLKDQEGVLVCPCLKFALQGRCGAVSAAVVHHHHHVGQGVHPHLLHLQILLQELHSRSTPQRALMMAT